MKPPELEDYDALLSRYAKKLRFDIENSETGDLTLLFGQVLRLLRKQSEFNSKIPLPFLFVARKHESNEPETCHYFQYNENRKFFLSDLYDYIQIQKKVSAHQNPQPTKTNLTSLKD